MFCSECGHENRNDRKFCAECGNKLKAYNEETKKEDLLMPVDIENEKFKVEKRNNINKVSSIIFWCIFVSAILLTIFSFIVKDEAKLALIIIASVCYISMLVVVIIKKSLLKRINKDKSTEKDEI